MLHHASIVFINTLHKLSVVVFVCGFAMILSPAFVSPCKYLVFMLIWCFTAETWWFWFPPFPWQWPWTSCARVGANKKKGVFVLCCFWNVCVSIKNSFISSLFMSMFLSDKKSQKNKCQPVIHSRLDKYWILHFEPTESIQKKEVSIKLWGIMQCCTVTCLASRQTPDWFVSPLVLLEEVSDPRCVFTRVLDLFSQLTGSNCPSPWLRQGKWSEFWFHPRLSATCEMLQCQMQCCTQFQKPPESNSKGVVKHTVRSGCSCLTRGLLNEKEKNMFYFKMLYWNCGDKSATSFGENWRNMAIKHDKTRWDFEGDAVMLPRRHGLGVNRFNRRFNRLQHCTCKPLTQVAWPLSHAAVRGPWRQIVTEYDKVGQEVSARNAFRTERKYLSTMLQFTPKWYH